MVKDVDNGEGYACVEAGDKWETFVSSSQFCCEPKTFVKNIYIFPKKVFQLKSGLVFFLIKLCF